MRLILLASLLLLVAGCTPKTDNTNSPDAAPVPTAQTNDGGPAPMTSGAAGGLTPMSGTENIQGAGGGGVGSAAKSMAKDRAAGAGGGSLSQMPMDEGQ